MSDAETSPNKNPESRQKAGALQKITVFAARKALEMAAWAVLGKDQLPATLKGLCEDAVLSPRLASPAENGKHLVYQQAHAGQWIAHDFRRGEFYPASVNKEWFVPHKEGILSAMMIDGIEDADQDTRTDLSIAEWFTADNIMSFDKPGIERLLDLGMVARRSHELAYEVADQESWIDELRSRGIAKDQVYQITPKAHSLVYISEDAGKKTPKSKPKLQLARVPGIIAH